VRAIEGDAEGIHLFKEGGWLKEPLRSECRVRDIFSCQIRVNLGNEYSFRRRKIHTKQKVVENFNL
jgi:hypothetical protein